MMSLLIKPALWVVKGLIGKLGESLVKIIMSMASEKFMTWMVLDVAERITKSTKNTVDDEWFNKIKEGLEDGQEQE